MGSSSSPLEFVMRVPETPPMMELIQEGSPQVASLHAFSSSLAHTEESHFLEFSWPVHHHELDAHEADTRVSWPVHHHEPDFELSWAVQHHELDTDEVSWPVHHHEPDTEDVSWAIHHHEPDAICWSSDTPELHSEESLNAKEPEVLLSTQTSEIQRSPFSDCDLTEFLQDGHLQLCYDAETERPSSQEIALLCSYLEREPQPISQLTLKLSNKFDIERVLKLKAVSDITVLLYRTPQEDTIHHLLEFKSLSQVGLLGNVSAAVQKEIITVFNQIQHGVILS